MFNANPNVGVLDPLANSKNKTMSTANG